MSIPSWCRAGAKVVCINDSWDRFPNPLSYGAVYEIEASRLYKGRSSAFGGVYEGAGLLLKGKPNPCRMDGLFCVLRFRPLVSQEDDLKAHFYHHLHQRASRKTEERV